MSRIELNYSRQHSSPIIIQDNYEALIAQWKAAKPGQTVVCITNHELEALAQKHLEPLFETEAKRFILHSIPSGESQKTLDTVSTLLDALCELKLERRDTIIAFGGGVIGDLVGFVTSIYLRGINLIQCPTSLLAQVDASIGGKTGVNHTSGKNLIGGFYQPLMTYINPSILSSLSVEEMRCGMAEIVKYGIIRDPELFSYLEADSDALAAYQYDDCPEQWTHIITRSAQNKAEVVQADEHEAGVRETLNLGHTFGHAIEAAHQYLGYRHGEAVALGMAIAANAAVSTGHLSSEARDRTLALLSALNFDLSLDHSRIPEYLSHLSSDKKVRNGKVRFILPTSIGDTTVHDSFTEDELTAAYHSLSHKGATS